MKGGLYALVIFEMCYQLVVPICRGVLDRQKMGTQGYSVDLKIPTGIINPWKINAFAGSESAKLVDYLSRLGYPVLNTRGWIIQSILEVGHPGI